MEWRHPGLVDDSAECLQTHAGCFDTRHVPVKTHSKWQALITRTPEISQSSPPEIFFPEREKLDSCSSLVPVMQPYLAKTHYMRSEMCTALCRPAKQDDVRVPTIQHPPFPSCCSRCQSQPNADVALGTTDEANCRCLTRQALGLPRGRIISKGQCLINT